MDRPADFRLERGSGGSGPEALALVGDWTSECLGKTGARLAGARKGGRELALDVSQLGRFDTAGAYALIKSGLGPRTPGLDERPDVAYLVELVQASLPAPAEAPRRFGPLYSFLMRMGRGVDGIWRETYQTFAFYGALQLALLRTVMNPSRLRLAPTFALMERAGLDAMPIVATTNFFVGATLAFLGADLLAQFGASIFTVEMIGVGVLREFAVLITAVILAGRSGSSFAAELGAMKMNQEVDAIQVLGVSPYEALILPRFIAMLVMTPLLTFVAVIAGLTGGVLVTWAVLDLSPAFFFQRLLDNVGLRHFWIGMSKAPVFAMVIASIGCRQGLEVGGDVEQLGRRVTSAVVEALFAIIILDACFALLYMELGQ
jgi:phospholipid/cholesterol/gamma-HCH transport system permease protein